MRFVCGAPHIEACPKNGYLFEFKKRFSNATKNSRKDGQIQKIKATDFKVSSQEKD